MDPRYVELLHLPTTVKSECSPVMQYTPALTELKEQADFDTVLANLSLAPDLSILKPNPPQARMHLRHFYS